MDMEIWAIIAGGLSLIVAVVLAMIVTKRKVENDKAREIAKSIRDGSMAFLGREYRILSIFVIVVAVVMFFALSWQIALTFLIGAIFSAIAVNICMRIATSANVRTAEASKNSIAEGLKTAFRSGSVMGFTVVGLGLLGVSILYVIFKDPQFVYGFGFGASSVALFARVGGGIYTKAADVGADLVGKVEKDIPEDDPRNPAVIADNVGDNVGDVAGMGADLFESYSDSIIAAMVLGSTAMASLGEKAIFYPMIIAAIGIVSSLIGSLFVRGKSESKLSAALNRGIFASAIIMAIASLFVTKGILGSYSYFWAVLAGLVSGIVIGLVTEYYTSSKQKPTQNIAKASETGAATNLIEGLSVGMVSTAIPILVVCVAIFLAFHFAGIYGIAIAAVGMLSTLGITLATDSYGPVADNAAGIAEMAGMGDETRKRAEALDAVGNTTAAIGKGFAIGSAALTALALLVSYTEVVGIEVIDLIDPKVIIGLFIGGMLPFLFSAVSMKAVGRAAIAMVEEVRRQFREISGLMEGTKKPDYKSCVDISTGAALREMIFPGILAIAAPVAVGFLLGPASLAGLLTGALVTGFLMAVMMANSGGAWDNAKKYIEEGNLGGKGSDAHKAAVVGDTVGDPFKDTSGPSLNILIKLMSIVALIIAVLL